MFSGIIEEIGTVKNISSFPGGKKITIGARKIMMDLAVDNSVAVSGVCLTVIQVSKSTFVAEAVGETMNKTNLIHIKYGQKVNLERALKATDRIGGHIVQGHVDGIGVIKKLIRRGNNWLLGIEIPTELKKYVVSEGSITIDGISLTVASLKGINCSISVIPFTFNNTTLAGSKVGDQCNIETDIMAKYVENFYQQSSRKQTESKISADWLTKKGY